MSHIARYRALTGLVVDDPFTGRSGILLLFLALTASLLWPAPDVQAGPQLGPADVLILVNANSPVSRSIADLYCRYHLEITPDQVLQLTGLPDSASLAAGPADEIITRDQFETLIAQPVRNYLISNGKVNSVQCIITTAGMPYRIEDTSATLANVVMEAASDANLTVTNRNLVNAASVESELTVLFQIDPALATGRLAVENRAVNPYQGYSSSIKAWSGNRDILNRRSTLRWTNMWRASKSPRIEGLRGSTGAGYGYSAFNRIMSPADLYLVARLEGQRVRGRYAIFAVRDMLDRAAAVSDFSSRHFVGYNPAASAVVIDDSANTPLATFSYSIVHNFPPQPAGMLSFEQFAVPPGAESFTFSGWNEGNHYDLAFSYLTGQTPPPDATLSQPVGTGLGGTLLWDDTVSILSSSFLSAGNGLLALLTYGRNAGDGRPANYLLTAGPGQGPLFPCVPGAVFSSLESFNAVTMFTDTATSQEKIAEFIQIGGSGAIGHAFEPEAGALVQGDFLLRNLLRDDDADGVADLSWVEAAYSAIPYVSWSEVVIGDPLMRLRTGPGGIVSLTKYPGDTDGDRFIGYADLFKVLGAFDGMIGNPLYDPAADLDQDGFVGYGDLFQVLGNFNSAY